MTPILKAKQAFTKHVILKLLYIALVLLAMLAVFLFALSGAAIALLLVIPLGISGLIVALKVPPEVGRAIGYIATSIVTLLLAVGIIILVCTVTYSVGTNVIETFGLSRLKLLQGFGSASLILLSLVAVIWWRTKGFSAQAERGM